MISERVFAFLIHVCLPVTGGMVTYAFTDTRYVEGFVQNHLADGLWAYAFMSFMLLVWERKLSFFWILVTVLVTLGYEGAQYLQFVQGTGDWWDVITYLLFFSVALLINYSIICHNQQPKQHDQN